MSATAELALRPEWQLFVNEYLKDLNAGKAAKRAGFGNSPESQWVIGSRLLSNVKIRKEVQKAIKRRLKRIEAKQDDVVNELALIALSDVQDYQVDNATGELIVREGRKSSRAVQSVKHKRTIRTDDNGYTEETITTEYKLWDKLKALDLLMKHMGMIKGEVTSTDLHLHQHEGDTVNYSGITIEDLKAIRGKLLALGSGSPAAGIESGNLSQEPV